MEQISSPKPGNQKTAFETLRHYYRKGVLEAVTLLRHRIAHPRDSLPSDVFHALWYAGILVNKDTGEYELTPGQLERVYPFHHGENQGNIMAHNWFSPLHGFRLSKYKMVSGLHELVWLADDLDGEWGLRDYLACLQWEGFITLESCEIFTPKKEAIMGVKSPWKQFRNQSHAVVRLYVNKEAAR